MIEWYHDGGWIYLWGIAGGLALSALLRFLGIDKGDGPGDFPDFDGGD